ncbi:MAG TPA: thiamine biosynthesis protein [Candidatus Corynebacterium gallistercoris]|uniref:Thiamine biosynthesis protein n=1 Tax=Candidatus Corynebacterium gallistercoris TaxID=2838530 RepID=A0A9D1UR97_9CORY|nr:thiamine biosynthesis protein [Candidatus Corynebacterium gallistercoris]
MRNLPNNKHSLRSPRAAALAIIGAGALVLVGCSTEEAKDAVSDASTAAESAASDASSAASSVKESATADSDKDGDIDLEITPDLDQPVQADSDLQVKVTGLNPDLGYYLAICKDDDAARVPDCTGERGDGTAQQWIKAEGGTVTLNEDGTAEATLKAVPTGENVDCTTDKCVVKLFGDHTEGFKPYEDEEITFA